MFTKDDLKQFKAIGIKETTIEQQLNNFKKGFDFVSLVKPATIGDGIEKLDNPSEYAKTYDEARSNKDIIKMVPASGSATRMFKALFTFMETYQDNAEAYLKFVQDKSSTGIFTFFEHIDELPFYERLRDKMWADGLVLENLVKKRDFKRILEYILTNKHGLNYGNTPKALVDFHIYRDFVRTAFDEHLVEGALYCKDKDNETHIHFTVGKDVESLFSARLKKTSKVFTKMFDTKYDVTFSYQEPSTDTVSIDANGEIVRDEKGQILFRPAGHGALIHNLNALKADIVFIKTIDNVIPDRFKEDTILYKKALAGKLIKLQETVFEYITLLGKKPTKADFLAIEKFIKTQFGISEIKTSFKNDKEHAEYLIDILDRPIRVCGMVKNEGEPGGGPFWVKATDGSVKLMIIESAQINMSDAAQKKIFNSSTHFNPVDIVCGMKNYKGKKFNIENYIDASQGFITTKSIKGKDIKVQELPGLWNGAMANWLTSFVEVPLSTFTPVKTVFDLFKIEHRNVIK